MPMGRRQIIDWLREERQEKLALLWREADGIRRRRVGEEVHLRGLIEISNNCGRECHYCGLRAGNRLIRRYRMTAEEIMACVMEALAYGYGTVVMQSGEDEGITADWMAGIIRRIRRETSLAVTLSLARRRCRPVSPALRDLEPRAVRTNSPPARRRALPPGDPEKPRGDGV
jgi:biotin synthase